MHTTTLVCFNSTFSKDSKLQKDQRSPRKKHKGFVLQHKDLKETLPTLSIKQENAKHHFAYKIVKTRITTVCLQAKSQKLQSKANGQKMNMNKNKKIKKKS
jgi:hypothetical protein